MEISNGSFLIAYAILVAVFSATVIVSEVLSRRRWKANIQAMSDFAEFLEEFNRKHPELPKHIHAKPVGESKDVQG